MNNPEGGGGPPQQPNPPQPHGGGGHQNKNRHRNQRFRGRHGGGGGGGGGGGNNFNPAQHHGGDPNGGSTAAAEEAFERELLAAEAAALAAGGPPPKVLNLTELRRKSAAELLEIAEKQGVENISRARKQDLLFQLIRAASRRGEHIYVEGVLEMMQDGYGFLRSPDSSYTPGPDDVYISPSQIRRFTLRTGDTIAGRVRPPQGQRALLRTAKVDTINFEAPEASKKKVNFENLTPLFADERFQMERGNGTTEDITARVIDLVAPFGKGQRGLIVSPPKAGKTIMLQNIAQSLMANYPEALPDRTAGRRAAGGSHRHAAHRARRSRGVDLRRARHAPCAGRRHGDREGQAPGRAQA